MIAIIGPLAIDNIFYPDSLSKRRVGGTIYYSGITLAKIGIDSLLFPVLSEKDKAFLNYFQDYESHNRKKIKIFPIYDSCTTEFNIRYKNNANERDFELILVSNPIFYEKIAENIQTCDKVIIASLNRTDFPLETVKKLREHSRIFISLQGFLRDYDKENKKLYLKDLPNVKDYLSLAELVIGDKNEACFLAKEDNLKKAAEKIASFGPEEVIITKGSEGSVIYSKQNDELFQIPAFKPNKLVDVTGSGDTYLAAYLAKRLESEDIQECGEFAAMCATLKIENSKILKDKIEENIKLYKNIST